MTHTKQFLMGMFAAYMGCEVMDIRKNRIGKVVSINKIRVWYEHENSNVVKSIVQHFAFYAEIKPILTPLSEITDEDLIKILGWEHYAGIEIKQKQVSVESVFASAFCTNSKGVEKAKGLTSSLIFDCLPLRHTDYLRSKYYDCGYMHIPSLITAGLAIKKTT